MNIYEAFTRLKKNPNLTIKRGNKEFTTIFGDVYLKVNFHNQIGYTKFDSFNLEYILADDWEVIEA